MDDDGLLTHVRGLDPEAVASLCDTADRQLRLHLEIHPDPPLYGALRRLAARDPRLVTGLSTDATVAFTVGWRFDRRRRQAGVELLRLAVGEVVLGLSGKDRPSWIGQLRASLAGRVRRVGWEERAGEVAARWQGALLCNDPALRAGAARGAEVLAYPPFEHGRLELVRGSDRHGRARGPVRPMFGDALVDARHLGVGAIEALRLVEAAVVRPPDVLIVEAAGAAQRDPSAVRAWLDGLIHGANATLEQVLHVGPPAPGGQPEASEEAPKGLPFP